MKITVRFAFAVGLFAFVGLTGCGGDVSTTSGSSSGSGSGGAGGSGSGAGGGQSAPCPVEEPTSASPCDVGPNVECTYGDACCPAPYTCVGGLWNASDVTCPAPASCPSEPPIAGSPCAGPCVQTAPCGYKCVQGASVLAVCSNDKWEITSSPCSDVTACGDAMCVPGQVCVEKAGGAGFFYSCESDPCAPGPLSCECAAGLCGGDPFECTINAPVQVACSCSMCP